MTTPLLPDDYLSLLNPAWSASELTGTIERLNATSDHEVLVGSNNVDE